MIDPSLSVGVTGLLITVYSLSVSLLGLSVIKIPHSRTRKSYRPVGNIYRLAEVTGCTVTFPTQSVCHHLQPGTPYLGKPDAQYRQACFINRQGGK